MEGDDAACSCSSKPTDSLKKRSAGTTSVVWNYFNLQEAKNKVNCTFCKQELCYNRNTSVMREHLKRKHVHVNLNDESKHDSNRYASMLESYPTLIYTGLE